MYTIQDKLIADVKDYALHKKGMRDAGERIDKEARELLVELQKVKGWECMIKSCKEHYAQYPNQFFGWCAVTHTDDAIQFVKGYSDGDEYEVLEINLHKSLELQVKERQLELKREKDKEESRIKERELSELNRLKAKYET